MATMHASQNVISMTKMTKVIDIPPFVNSLQSRENMHPIIDTANTTALVAKKIKSTKVLMPRWCWSKLHGLSIRHTAYMTAVTHIHASTARLQL